MRAVKHLPNYTYSDYLLWEGDWELIDGIPYAMSPSPISDHQIFSLLLGSEILTALRNNKETCGKCKVIPDIDWIINEQTVLKPDISVVCDHKGKFIKSPPVLVVEILSPSTAHKDKTVKYEIYAEQGVRYYVIVDILSLSYKAYELVDKQYQEYSDNIFEIHSGCAITINIVKVLSELAD
jgi:Uma2 family endonuclease